MCSCFQIQSEMKKTSSSIWLCLCCCCRIRCGKEHSYLIISGYLLLLLLLLLLIYIDGYTQKSLCNRIFRSKKIPMLLLGIVIYSRRMQLLQLALVPLFAIMPFGNRFLIHDIGYTGGSKTDFKIRTPNLYYVHKCFQHSLTFDADF